MNLNEALNKTGAEIMPGYLEDELPSVEQRIADAKDLSSRGKLRAGVNVKKGHDIEPTVRQDLLQSIRNLLREGKVIIGPAVFPPDEKHDDYFAENGIGVWLINDK